MALGKSGWRKQLFDPKSRDPFKISRSKIDLFIDCPRCLYLSERLGVSRPQFPAFTLNNAVDELLKKEFDIHRANGTAHPLMKTYGVDAIPLRDERMEQWRDALRRGIQYHHTPTNLLVRGGVDDVWVAPSGELIIVDYKATSKKGEINLEGRWQQGYKRQLEVYQWLFRQNGFKVSDTGYFVYVNGRTDRKAFDARLEFDVMLISYKGSDEWIVPTLEKIRAALESETPPAKSPECEYCGYREAAGKILLEKEKEHHVGKKPERAAEAVRSGKLF